MTSYEIEALIDDGGFTVDECGLFFGKDQTADPQNPHRFFGAKTHGVDDIEREFCSWSEH